MTVRRSGKAPPVVRVLGAQTSRVIRGTTDPDAEVDAVNLSASAAEPTGFHDTVVIARADARGRFEGSLPMREGDVVRIRARGRRGPAGPWLFHAKGLGGSPRGPQVALGRIGLCDLGTGSIRVFNLSSTRPIAAPGTQLVLVNERTKASVTLVVDERGSFAGTPRVPGRGGDVLRVETSSDQRRLAGTLITPSAAPGSAARPAPSPDWVAPSRLHQRQGFLPNVRRFRAPLFAGPARPDDVVQSELPNCHIASASASLAHARPELLERLIVRLGDDRVRVRFRLRDPATRSRVARDVEINTDLFVRPSGELLYGSTGSRRAAPLWWPLLEKAFARLKGSYKHISDGGCADLILEALLGRPARRFFIDAKAPGEADRIWRELQEAFDARRPVVAGTSSYSPRTYRNTGLVPNHAYSVLSCRDARGRRWVGVRNPWGEDAEAPCRARKNGRLELELDQFVRLFCVISTVR